MNLRKIILVAEDNLSNFKLLDAVLSKDYDLIHAWNGKEAVEMFEQHQPQLVLMDITMPVMDGYEATRAIRRLEDREKAKVPVIAVSANAFDEDREASRAAGMNGHLAKPIIAADLLEMLGKIIQGL